MHRCCRASSKSNGLRIFIGEAVQGHSMHPRISHLGAPDFTNDWGQLWKCGLAIRCFGRSPTKVIPFALGLPVESLRLHWRPPASWNLSWWCSATDTKRRQKSEASASSPTIPQRCPVVGGQQMDMSPGAKWPRKHVFFNTWRTFRSKRWLRPTSTGIPHRTAGLERTSSCSSYTMPFQGQRFPWNSLYHSCTILSVVCHTIVENFIQVQIAILRIPILGWRTPAQVARLEPSWLARTCASSTATWANTWRLCINVSSN